MRRRLVIRTVVPCGAALLLAAVGEAGAQIRAPRPSGIPATSDVAIIRDRSFAIGLGAGLGSVGLAITGDGTYWRRATSYRLRLALQGGFGSDDVRAVTEVNALVGTGGPTFGNWGTASIGLGSVSVERADGDHGAVGLVGEAQLISARAPHLALTLGGNVNPELSLFSVTVSVLLGRVPFSGTPGPIR